MSELTYEQLVSKLSSTELNTSAKMFRHCNNSVESQLQVLEFMNFVKDNNLSKSLPSLDLYDDGTDKIGVMFYSLDSYRWVGCYGNGVKIYADTSLENFKQLINFTETVLND